MRTTRRGLLIAGTGLVLAGCDRLNDSQGFRRGLRSAEKLTMEAQRLISSREARAREFSAADISPVFRSNGNSFSRSRISSSRAAYFSWSVR